MIGLSDVLSTEDFDEAWYLQEYEDIRTAVASGVFGSGRQHFAEFGYEEGRTGRVLTTGVLFSIYDPLAFDDPLEQTKSAWSVSAEEQAQAVGWYWMAHPMVRRRVHEKLSGDADIDGYGRLVELLRDRGMAVPIPRSLSLGCGFGALERDLAARGLIADCDAVDIADAAVAEASRLAVGGGYSRLAYRVADLDTEDLPESHYDVVFAHQSVHHVERLEELFEKIAKTLRPGGLFHLNEFVGPTRFQWTDDQLDLVNGFLDTLPAELRRTPRGQKGRVLRPTVEAMIRADPSESIRSSEIMTALARRFRIVELRPYGGTLLHLGLGEIAQNFREDEPEHRAYLDRFFELEDTMMEQGRIGSDYVVVVAEPLI